MASPTRGGSPDPAWRETWSWSESSWPRHALCLSGAVTGEFEVVRRTGERCVGHTRWDVPVATGESEVSVWRCGDGTESEVPELRRRLLPGCDLPLRGDTRVSGTRECRENRVESVWRRCRTIFTPRWSQREDQSLESLRETLEYESTQSWPSRGPELDKRLRDSQQRVLASLGEACAERRGNGRMSGCYVSGL